MANNPLRAVFWETFNATRADNSAAFNALLTALNSLVPAHMRWIGNWEILTLSPDKDKGERHVGDRFVADASGGIRAEIRLHFEVRDARGIYPHLEWIDLKTRFVMRKDGESFVLSSEFEPEAGYNISDPSSLQQLAEVVLRGLEQRVRARAIASVPS